jgi:thiosulfate dehydrogenase (quinone) large subunit
MSADMNERSMPTAPPRRIVAMDRAGLIRIPLGGAVTAAMMRITLGLVYLWAFIAQGFGVIYTNKAAAPADAAAPAKLDYSWHFSYDASKGWISSGFSHSPTEAFVSKNLDGPLAFIPQKLPTGLVDFLWIFALAGLGIGLTLGIASNIAGWGGFALNVIIWFSTFPPSTNPIIDAEHATFALAFLLLMWLQASNYWGIGRWWRVHTPALLN